MTYLDLSKSLKKDKLLFTDVRELATLTSLVWLNLSFTAIVDSSIFAICKGISGLQYLALNCCSDISDLSCQELRKLSLLGLDICGCKRITDEGFIFLFGDPDKSSKQADKSFRNLQKSLTMFLCSFLPAIKAQSSKLLLKLTQLKKLEMRSTAISTTDMETLRENLDIAIFNHTDQLIKSNDFFPFHDVLSTEKELIHIKKWPYSIY